jgi:hypothetical protein
MILQEFSKILRSYPAHIPATVILTRWLKEILLKKPENNVEKIIHAELTLIQNEDGAYAIVGTRKSGQKLLENLHKYINSYENHNFSRWLHRLKPTDFKE